MLRETLQARLKELAAAIKALTTKADITAEELADLNGKTKEIGDIEAKLKDLDAAEAAAARVAVPADNTAGQTAAQPKKDLTSAEKVELLVVGMVSALKDEGTRGFKPTMRALEANGYGQLAREFEPAQKRTLNSSNATAGGILLPENMSNDIIDILRVNTTFLQGNPTRIPMPNGSYKVPAGATGATAAYRGEAKRVAVTEPTFKAINMSAKLLGALVPVSNQLIRWSGPDVGAWVRRDLSIAMGTKMDEKFYFGDGTADTPLGLHEISGIYSVAATGAATPTYTQVDSDARKLLNALENNNVPMIGVEWRMAPRVFGYLADLRDGNGNAIYPTLQGNSPTFKGYLVRKTTQYPINLGGTTDESYISLVAYGHVFFGDTMTMQLAVTDVGSALNGAETIHAFQQGMTLIKAEAEHDIDVRYVEAVAELSGVRWGA